MVTEYFSDENIDFIRDKVAEISNRETGRSIYYDSYSIKRIMLRVVAEKRENIYKMNKRAIMYLCDDFRKMVIV